MKKPSRHPPKPHHPPQPKAPKPSYTVSNATAIKLALSTYLLLAKKNQQTKAPAAVRRTLLKWVEENLEVLKKKTN
jgi:hypothetical protein